MSSGTPSHPDSAASALTTFLDPPERPTLGPHEVHVWRVDVTPSGDRVFDACLAQLSADEHARFARLPAGPLRASFAMRRAALRRILGGYLACDPRDVDYRVSPRGKPEAVPPVEDQADPPLRFSTSSSHALALVGVTRGRDLGVDIEHVRALADLDAVARTVFSPAERAEYEALAPGERAAAFFHGWTRKEAWLKARGEGVIGNLADFDVTLAPGTTPRVRRVAGEAGEPGAWTIVAGEPGDGYVGAVAVRDHAPRWSAWHFREASLLGG